MPVAELAQSFGRRGESPKVLATSATLEQAISAARSMGPLNRSTVTLCLLCLGLTSAFCFAQDDQEVPQGYEDAPVAGEAAPPAEAGGMEDGDTSLIEVLTDALVGEQDPNIANLQRQFLPQFQQMWKAELAFVQRVCSLDKQQRERFEKAGNIVTGAAAKEYAVAQNKMMHRGNDPFGGASAMRDPRRIMRERMAKSAKDKLSPEQAARYQEECSKRDTHNRRVTVLNLVARLDEHLVLAADQRNKLIEVLSANYQYGWEQSLEMFQHNQQYLPSIPDQQIVPILNPAQTTAWRGAQKQSPIFMGGIGFAQAAVIIDDGGDFVEEVEIEVEEQ